MKLCCQSFLLPGSLVLFWLATTCPLSAQVVEDTSLPTPSTVTTVGNTRIITGGTQTGTNLFHSFQEFSVPRGGVASFRQINQGIENVISRVTGSSVSTIDGLIQLLQVNGTVSAANLFLINPNGMIFGRNAALNMGGSFIASTASRLNFADGYSFSATNYPTTEPLLTMSVPIGLQFGSSVASIQMQGALLQVPSGKTLGLVGGGLTLFGGGLSTAGGRIELGSVAGVVTSNLAPVQISLTPIDKGWALSYEGIEDFQDIQLSQQAIVTVSGSGGGDIQVQGKQVTLTGGSQMNASTQGSNPGGTLAVIASDSVDISGTSTDGLPSGLFARVSLDATGSGGNLTIETRQLTVLEGAEVSTSTSGSGKAGNITVRATESVLVSGTDNFNFGSSLRTTVQPGATGDGGDLTVETGRLLVQDGAQVLTSTFGQGQAGDLAVQNATEVELVGGIAADDNFFPSGLLTTSQGQATGNGGNLLVSTGKLTLRNGAQVSSTTFSMGKAGALTVRATDVELVGAAFSADGQLLIDQTTGLAFGSGLYAGTSNNSQGDGATLTVIADRLSLRDGAAVQSATFGAGDAGDLIVQASDSIELIGTFADQRFPTSLSAFSGGIPGLTGVTDATGRGGDLTIETGELIIRERAAVTVSSLNSASDAKGAGNIDITAQTIRLDNEATLTAETASGNGGNMTLQVQDVLLLRGNSAISTEAGTAGAGGNGGNLTIDAGFLVAPPQENSDIIANAFNGNGGNIELRSQSIFGLQYRNELAPRLNTTSDITASSQFGLAGTVTINTPDVDPSRGLVVLPTNLVDASGLIAESCRGSGRATAREQNQFIVTGRGGLPPSPSDALSTQAVWQDLRPLARQAANRSVEVSSELDVKHTPGPSPIVEAQGWVINNKGEVVLTATAPSVTPHIPWLTQATC